MSQPPQPPSQPPSGGFGAPPDPYVPPAGPPQPPQPPAMPPQAPSVAPWSGVQAAGQPPGPPNPYAQQQPYGPYPPPNVPPNGGGASTRRKALIIGTAVAVVLAIGGGAWFLTGSDDSKKPEAGKSDAANKDDESADSAGDGGADGGGDEAGGRSGTDDGLTGSGDGETKVLWQKPAPEVPRSGVDAPGLWVTEQVAVKAALTSVTAYAVADGKEKWSVALDGNVCAASVNTTEDAKVVVAYEGAKKDECSHLAMVDLKTGEKGWDKPLPKGGGFGSGFIGTTVAVSGDRAGVSWFGGSAMFRVGDGKELPKAERVSGCTAGGFAGGTSLLRGLSCTAGGRLQKLDSATGKVEWSYQAPKGFNVSNVFSTDPVVISLSDEDNKSGGILAIDDQGKVRSTIGLGKDTYQPSCGMSVMSQKLDGCQGVAATADTFFLPTEEKESEGEGHGRSNEIHAFDLDTGKRKWKATAGEGRSMMPLRAEGDNLIAYGKPSYDKSGEIFSISPKGGKPKSLMKNPDAATDAEGGFFSSTLAYEDGRFYIASDRVTGTSSGGPEKLLLVLGSN